MNSDDTYRTAAPVALADCALADALELVGDRWKLLILREVFYGVRRFADIHSDIDIPRSVLSTRLRELVDADILMRSEYREGTQRARYEYSFTPKGQDLLLPLAALWQWGTKYASSSASEPTFIDKTTGKVVRVGFSPQDRQNDLSQIRCEISRTPSS